MKPLITFGMIVLNGEPFTRYNMRSIYPWAHQIIVVEGACRTAKAVATPDGHSIDGTLRSLTRFQTEEDPEKKVLVISARDEGFKDGFWPEKTEMCQAFAKHATGNYLWQIDSDEFYREQDMPVLIKLMEDGVGQIAFPQQSFWGGIDHVNNSLFLARFAIRGIPRIFAWGPGHKYTSHRPSTVVDAQGRNVRANGDVSSLTMRRRGIYMYHYCLVFPSQVLTKIGYYGVDSQAKAEQGGGFSSTILFWHGSNFKRITRPYHLHNVSGCLSWVCTFRGTHPAQVVKMMADIRDGRVSHELRQTDDIESLMHSGRYRAATWLLDRMVTAATSRFGAPVYRLGHMVASHAKKVFRLLQGNSAI